jgi:tetratricopeptide (TPR) repeat protein
MTLRHQALYCANPEAAVGLLEEAVAVSSGGNDQRELALALAYLATAHEWQGDHVTAHKLSEQAVLAGRAAGDPAALTEALLRLASEKLLARDFHTALVYMQEALALSWDIDYRNYIGIITRQLAWVALEKGDINLACGHLVSCLEIASDSANGAEGLRPLKLAARVMIAVGRPAEAVRLLGAAEAWQLRHELQPERALWTTRWTLPGDEEGLRVAHAQLTEDEFLAARTSGRGLSLDEVLREADRHIREVQADTAP